MSNKRKREIRSIARTTGISYQAASEPSALAARQRDSVDVSRRRARAARSIRKAMQALSREDIDEVFCSEALVPLLLEKGVLTIAVGRPRPDFDGSPWPPERGSYTVTLELDEHARAVLGAPQFAITVPGDFPRAMARSEQSGPMHIALEPEDASER